MPTITFHGRTLTRHGADVAVPTISPLLPIYQPEPFENPDAHEVADEKGYSVVWGPTMKFVLEAPVEIPAERLAIYDAMKRVLLGREGYRILSAEPQEPEPSA